VVKSPKQALDGAAEPGDAGSAAPYVGMRPHGTADAARFFGRSAESHEVAALWRSHRLTVLSGPAGAGKTSLLAAGVLPLLDPNHIDTLPVGRLSGGSPFPVAALSEHNPHTLALLQSWSPGEAPNRLSALTVGGFLRRWDRRIRWHGRPAPLLLAIDQVEELFAAGPRQDRYRLPFLEELTEALDELPDLHLLLVVRDDSRHELAEHPELGGTPTASFRLRAPGPGAALEAVRGPAAAAGRPFAPGAAEKLVADLRTSQVTDADGSRSTLVSDLVEPALLQAVCARLWAELPGGTREITTEWVRRRGGADRWLADMVAEAVAGAADDGMVPVAQLQDWLPGTFVTGQGLRRPVAEGPASTAGMPNVVLRALQDRHLLSAEWRDGSRWYRLRHDRLLAPLRRVGRGPLPAPPPVPAQERLHTAQRALAAGDTGLAEGQAERALEDIDEADLRQRAEAELLLGNVAHERGDPVTAEARYRRAAQLLEVLQDTPAVARLLAATGQSLLAQGRRAEAVDELHAAVGRLPGDLSVQTDLGWMLWLLGHRQAAVAVLTGVLAVDGSAPAALRARGEILSDMGDAAAALRDLDRVHRHPEPSTRAARGLALAALGQRRAADREINAALADAPGNGRVLFYAARHAALTGDRSAADLAGRALAATDPPLPPHQREVALSLAGTPQ
jgi:Flp pilus assembly protein TadD